MIVNPNVLKFLIIIRIDFSLKTISCFEKVPNSVNLNKVQVWGQLFL